MKHVPRPAVVVACAALFAALGGSAVAGSVITSRDVKNNSLTGRDIRNRSLTRQDFTGSVRRALAGTIAATVERLGPEVALGASGSGSEAQGAKAECPAETVIVGGGWRAGARTFIAQAVKSGNGYFVIGVNDGPSPGSIQAQAICAPAVAGTAAAAGNPAAVERAESRMLADVRAQAAAAP